MKSIHSNKKEILLTECRARNEDGKTYVSCRTFPLGKEAEHDAAKTALEQITEMVKDKELSNIKAVCFNFSFIHHICLAN